MDSGNLESGGGAPGGSQGPRPSNKRLQQTQAQVDEVVGIMKVIVFLCVAVNIRTCMKNYFENY